MLHIFQELWRDTYNLYYVQDRSNSSKTCDVMQNFNNILDLAEEEKIKLE